MKTSSFILAGISLVVIVVIGWLATPYVLAGRVMPGVHLGGENMSGVKLADIEGVLDVYEAALLQKIVTLQLREKSMEYSLGELGFSLNREATIRAIRSSSNKVYLPVSYEVRPVLQLDSDVADEILRDGFADKLAFPQNASLELNSTGHIQLIESASGEKVDLITLEEEVAAQDIWSKSLPVELVVIQAAADVQDNEVAVARELAAELLRDGLTLTYEERTFSMRPFTVRRLLEFIEIEDPADAGNKILGVQLNPEGLTEYLVTTIVPTINREPVNARFEFKDERVEQFSVPSTGQMLIIEETVEGINGALNDNMTEAMLSVEITDPAIKTNEDIEEMGITTLLAVGESDFKGSPPNRVHNIHVGAAKYHGLLIEPEQEFSFNEFLGPVTAAAGFKPELVIKGNQTIPEYGGGLCQVSSTIFRAAAHSGLEITQRRNHSYAVQYYGTPGFDATIYPPYTDLRFLNNTPGYILVQVKITGTIISFEFWGTDDGRKVEVTSPYIYDRQPNGAMKAIVKQTVTRDGQTVIEDTFYSNYRSPELFPRVLAEDGATPVEE